MQHTQTRPASMNAAAEIQPTRRLQADVCDFIGLNNRLASQVSRLEDVGDRLRGSPPPASAGQASKCDDAMGTMGALESSAMSFSLLLDRLENALCRVETEA